LLLKDILNLSYKNFVEDNSFPHSSFHSQKENKFVWINHPKSIVELNHLDQKKIFITSCNEEIALSLKQKKFDALKFGKEAILDLNEEHFHKKSLRDVIRAGSRHGVIEEISFSEEARQKLEEFKLECTHGRKPQIKYFFNDTFNPQNRLFVCRKNNDWIAAILVSQLDDTFLRSELLLRIKTAPNGVMDALIFSVFNKFKEEGFNYWSLGDVPFIVKPKHKISREYLVNFLGRRLKFAYNYSGLFKFKNKFNPIWSDVYICSKQKLNLSALLFLTSKSNLTKLVLSGLLSLLGLFHN
jgi:glycosyltransferase 2 family protein